MSVPERKFDSIWSYHNDRHGKEWGIDFVENDKFPNWIDVAFQHEGVELKLQIPRGLYDDLRAKIKASK